VCVWGGDGRAASGSFIMNSSRKVLVACVRWDAWSCRFRPLEFVSCNGRCYI